MALESNYISRLKANRLHIDAIVRVNCCGNPARLTIVVSGAGTSVNAEMSVFKL